MRTPARRALIALAAATAAAGCIPPTSYPPPAQSGLFLEGQEHFLNGDFENAAKCFQQFITRHPRSPQLAEVHYWLGACRLKQQRTVNAEKAFRTCLALKPRGLLELQAWTGVGDCYRIQQRFDLAARTYERVLRTGSVEIERDLMAFHQGLCLLRGGDFPAGRKVLQECAAAYPSTQWGAAAREKLKQAESFSVQTGMFSVRANAEKHAARLRGKGFAPRIEACSGSLCVRVGSVSTWAETRSLASRLRAAGFDTLCLP